jgi:hypothetical protein
MLPSKPNRALLNVLVKGYITEEFQYLSNAIANTLGNPLARDNPSFSQAVLKTLNNILLDNVMSYITSSEKYHFATVVGYNQFICNCQVRVKYLDEFFDRWSAIREDKEETERAIVHSMLYWLHGYYQSHAQDLNACLLQLHEAMMIYTPHRHVRTYRFEIDPELRPLLIYTDTTPTFHETATV